MQARRDRGDAGREEGLLGFQVGVRESAQSWRELLVELKARGLAIAPELATGDGALSQDTARLMVFKLIMAAAKTWRRLKGENQLPKVIAGVTIPQWRRGDRRA